MARFRPSASGWLLPVATGLLLALAFPPLDLVVPAFVALVPLAVHLDRLGARHPERGADRHGAWRRRAARAAFRAGALAGGVAWALLLAWIPPALMPWSPVAVLLYPVAVAVLAGVTGLVAVAVHGIRVGAGVPLALALPLAWTAGEWLRAHLPGPLAFPWLELATSLADHPEWIGIAELVGGRGVGFWLAAVSGLLASAWRLAEGRPVDGGPVEAGPASAAGGTAGARSAGSWAAWATAGAALVLAVAIPVWGAARAGALDVRPLVRVAAVQPDVTRRTHPDPDAMRRAVDQALDRLAPTVAAAGVALVVLPEAVYPDTLPAGRSTGDEGAAPVGSPGAAGIPPEGTHPAEARLMAFAERVGAPVLAGALTAGPARPMVHNSVVLVAPGGRVPWRWQKRHLVPFVERVPLLPLLPVAEGAAGYVPGRGGVPAPVTPDLRVGAFVCYESAFAGVARELVAAGADLLVNVTNDGWFGGPGFPTHALWQHPAHLVVRAVETRTAVVRAASTGFSLVVDPVGRVGGRTALFREEVLVADPGGVRSATAFVRFGDVAGAAATALTVLLLVVATFRPGPARGRHIEASKG